MTSYYIVKTKIENSYFMYEKPETICNFNFSIDCIVKKKFEFYPKGMDHVLPVKKKIYLDW